MQGAWALASALISTFQERKGCALLCLFNERREFQEHIARCTLQAFWALASVSKSNVKARKDAAGSILATAKKHQQAQAEQRKLYTQFPEFWDQCIKLCHFRPHDKVRCAPIRPLMSVSYTHL